MTINELKNKKVLILGFGKEGKDTFLFLRKLFPKKILGIADKLSFEKFDFQTKKILSHFSHGRRKCIIAHFGKKYLKSLKNYDVIIKSPGVPIHLPEVEKIYKKQSSSAQGYGGQRITSQTEIFLKNCPGKIVGVTGTKGKSTTASLIYRILKQGGLKPHLVGNIGRPVLNLLFSATPKDIYVYELSSHQLYNLEKSPASNALRSNAGRPASNALRSNAGRPASNALRSNAGRPQIAVLLNIYPEHLDYYKNFREYANAKANITKYQTKNDYLIFNSGDKIVREIARKSKAKKIPIKGKYYELDRNAAKAVGKIFKIPLRIIQKAIKKFKPLPHRLELVGTFKGITFYNDALSTIPETAIAAIDALGANVQTIMLGGYDRKIEFKNLAKSVFKSKIKNVILFPTTGEKIWKEILKLSRGRTSANLPRHFFVNSNDLAYGKNLDSRPARIMREAVKWAYKHTQKGKICLLSTASTSFSIFRDYREKGNLFKKYVRQYSA